MLATEFVEFLMHPTFRLCVLSLLDKEDNPDKFVYVRILGDGKINKSLAYNMLWIKI